MNSLLGFTPDAPTTTPGIILDCTQFIPYDSGMRAAPGPRSLADALAAACRGAVTVTKLAGTRRVFAGSSTKLYELSGTTWSDVSRGASYTLGSNAVWSFTQFGDTSVASSIDNVIQTSTAGAFADQATAPQATIVEAVLSSGGGFVMAFNTVDATYGTSPDRWWCCAINDETSWTVSLSTQATSGRLLSSPGAITAAKAFGDQNIAYKDRSLYLGRYVGSPAVWQWDLIPGDVGCIGVDAVTDIGGAGHVFVGRSDIMLFDGTRPQSIAEGQVRQWFYNNVSQAYLYRTSVLHDKQT